MGFIEFLSTAYYQVPAHPIAAMAGGGLRNYAVFQQNPTVVTAEPDVPMDLDAVIAQA